jgi:hypothetical protein
MVTLVTGTGVDQVQDGSIQTADLAAGAVTPAKVSGMVVTQANQNTLPAAATLASFTHGLGFVPISAEFEIVCLVADSGYSIGDVVTPFCAHNASTYGPLCVTKNATTVSVRTGASTSILITHNTTGAAAAPVASSWAWRFKVRAA